MSKVLVSLDKLGDILDAGLWVQSSLLVMQFMSPPMQPESNLLRRRCGRVSEKYCSLLFLDIESVPEGRYKFARVIGPILKTIARPLESRLMFSATKSDLIMEAVPYLEGELLDMMLKEEDKTLHLLKESSQMLISCR